MILRPIEYDLANLFVSDHAVAICETEGERLKNLILLGCEAGWGVVVVETVAGETYLITTAARIHEGNLCGNARKWSRDEGYHFLLKRSHEQISGPRQNVFVLPDGHVIEVRNILTRASNLTHWELQGQMVRAGYVRF